MLGCVENQHARIGSVECVYGKYVLSVVVILT